MMGSKESAANTDDATGANTFIERKMIHLIYNISLPILWTKVPQKEG
jgi:hypothetical protein